MTTIVPRTEQVHRAIRWISDQRAEHAGVNPLKLVQDASLKFDLSPAEEQWLTEMLGKPPPLDDAEVQLLRRQLLDKGAEVNEKLTRLWAGEDVDLEEILGGAAPGGTPAERLRRFLDVIDERVHAIGEGRYGRCDACGAPISFAQLREAPWATRCRHCAE